MKIIPTCRRPSDFLIPTRAVFFSVDETCVLLDYFQVAHVVLVFSFFTKFSKLYNL